MRDYVKRVAQMLPKMSQEQIRRVLNAVASENDMLDSILESLTTGLLVVDCSWKVLKFNKVAERYLSFGFFADETKVESLKLWELVSEPEIAEFLKGCAENDRTNVSEEFTTTSPGGRMRFLSVSIFSFVSHAERRGNIVKIYDITDKRTQEVRLRRMENMAGLTNLAAGMAHEIKNPLGAISIHIQLIQKALKKQRAGDGTLPEPKFLEEHLDVVNEEIDVLNKTVTDFLFAVRPVKADIALVEPVRTLRNIVQFFAPEFNKSDVEFTLEAPQKGPRLMIDEKLFREAVIN
ncbi:MAG: PAS domain S-box protein, partial [Treponemataceae bacterium]|nr:PAS domain S-box protein [Treponemataceae bacterium]